jgi:hypothetical protein
MLMDDTSASAPAATAGADAAATATTAAPAQENEGLRSEEKVPVDQLARLEQDRSVLFFGMIPLLVLAGVTIMAVALYFYRRGKNWNEIGEAMRIDDGDKPIGPEREAITTRDIAALPKGRDGRGPASGGPESASGDG